MWTETSQPQSPTILEQPWLRGERIGLGSGVSQWDLLSQLKALNLKSGIWGVRLRSEAGRQEKPWFAVPRYQLGTLTLDSGLVPWNFPVRTCQIELAPSCMRGVL